jgi:hypothetical protein
MGFLFGNNLEIPGHLACLDDSASFSGNFFLNKKL